MKFRPWLLLALVLCAVAGAWMMRGTPIATRIEQKIEGKKSVEDRLLEYGPTAKLRLGRMFREAGVGYPPREAVLLILKEEKVLRLFARERRGKLRFVWEYPVLAASGHAGPKLREGDCQVPEGIYRITYLNPNSLYHLSLRLNYPNSFDRRMSRAEGRTQLGGDIMIHGNSVSIGCIAVGDPGSEDMFTLAADTGMSNMRVIIAPYDFTTRGIEPLNPGTAPWVDTLYHSIAAEMSKLPTASPPR